jgi:hypothetical protein
MVRTPTPPDIDRGIELLDQRAGLLELASAVPTIDHAVARRLGVHAGSLLGLGLGIGGEGRVRDSAATAGGIALASGGRRGVRCRRRRPAASSVVHQGIGDDRAHLSGAEMMSVLDPLIGRDIDQLRDFDTIERAAGHAALRVRGFEDPLQ